MNNLGILFEQSYFFMLFALQMVKFYVVINQLSKSNFSESPNGFKIRSEFKISHKDYKDGKKCTNLCKDKNFLLANLSTPKHLSMVRGASSRI